MPLNSHSYLIAQGWQGTGKALREGAINRPVIIAQKKSLAGVGKDRDEAFPFWDHVFSAVATSINVKPSNDDSDEDADRLQLSGSSTNLDRTSTGILSSKPQKAGLPVLEVPATLHGGRPNIMALAKRESARRGLYSRFFRGPILCQDAEVRELPALDAVKRSSPSRADSNRPECCISTTEKKGKKRKFRGDGKTVVTQMKQKSNREDERKDRRRLLERSRKETEKREVYEIRMEGDIEITLTKMLEVDSVQDGDNAEYPHKNVCKKRRRHQ